MTFEIKFIKEMLMLSALDPSLLIIYHLKVLKVGVILA